MNVAGAHSAQLQRLRENVVPERTHDQVARLPSMSEGDSLIV
jgi:hypothetical protein